MADRIFAIFIILAAAFVWWTSSDYPFASRCLPAGVMGLVALIAVFILTKPETPGNFDRLFRLAVFTLVTLAAIIIMDTVGFFVAAAFFICAALPVQGVFRIRTTIVMTVSSVVVIYIVFIRFFKVPLPMVF